MQKAYFSFAAACLLVSLAGTGCMDQEGLRPRHDAGVGGQGTGGDGGGPGTGGRMSGSGGRGTGGNTMCGPVCAIACHWGNVLDAAGCPTCSCNPPPPCDPAIDCGTPPPGGPCPNPGGEVSQCVRDASGTCRWTPPRCEMCPPVLCDLYCPNGYKLDAAGCQTCACNPPPPECTPEQCGPAPGAPNYVCPDGTVAGPSCGRDAAAGVCGWKIIECPKSCPTIACPPIFCPNGYKVDANGCNTCECAPAKPCPAIDCARACPYGSRQDANGCETCDCIDAGTCSKRTDVASCRNDASCVWLSPGCGEPALASAGCYARADVGCTADTMCSGGRVCLKRIVHPCDPATAPPNAGICAACGQTQTVCL